MNRLLAVVLDALRNGFIARGVVLVVTLSGPTSMRVTTRPDLAL